MKINLSKTIRRDRDNIVGHIILESMVSTSKTFVEELFKGRPVYKTGKYKGMAKDLHTDVTLSVGGKEVNLKAFAAHWQSQVKGMIRAEAKEMIKEFIFDKLDPVNDLLYDFTKKLKEAIDPYLEDWERENYNIGDHVNEQD